MESLNCTICGCGDLNYTFSSGIKDLLTCDNCKSLFILDEDELIYIKEPD
jgi:hypothetical protein